MSRDGIITVAVTGGPCAGKTGVLDLVKETYGDKVIIVPEIATVLLNGGFPKPGVDIDYTPEWQYLFQRVATAAQLSFEDVYIMLAKKRGANAIVIDRGLIDGAAYMPNGLPEFCEMYGINVAKAFKRYDAVIHLESLATAQPALYSDANNASRYETLAEAQAIEMRIRQVWQGHRNLIFIRNHQTKEKMQRKVLRCLAKIMKENA